jgi:hypothetical protein
MSEPAHLFSHYAEDGGHGGERALPGGAQVQGTDFDADSVIGRLTSLGILLEALAGSSGRVGPDFDAWLGQELTDVLDAGLLNQKIRRQLSDDNQVWKVDIELKIADDQVIGRGTGESTTTARSGRDLTQTQERGSSRELAGKLGGEHIGIEGKAAQHETTTSGSGQQHEVEHGGQICAAKAYHRARIVAKVRVELQGFWIDKSTPFWQFDPDSVEYYNPSQTAEVPAGEIEYTTDDNIAAACPGG